MNEKKKKLMFILVGILSNIIMIISLSEVLQDKILIESKIDEKLLIIALVAYVLGSISISYGLHFLFGIKKQDVSYISLIIFLTISFGSALLTSVKSLLNIILREKDIIFENRFIRVFYLWDRSEIKNKILNIYKENGGRKIELTPEIEQFLLNETLQKGPNSYKITNLTEVIIKYIGEEKIKMDQKDPFTILYSIYETGINMISTYPKLSAIIGLAGLAGLIAAGRYFEIYHHIGELRKGLQVAAKNDEMLKETSIVIFKQLKELATILSLNNGYLREIIKVNGSMHKFTGYLIVGMAADLGLHHSTSYLGKLKEYKTFLDKFKMLSNLNNQRIKDIPEGIGHNLGGVNNPNIREAILRAAEGRLGNNEE